MSLERKTPKHVRKPDGIMPMNMYISRSKIHIYFNIINDIAQNPILFVPNKYKKTSFTTLEVRESSKAQQSKFTTDAVLVSDIFNQFYGDFIMAAPLHRNVLDERLTSLAEPMHIPFVVIC